MQKRRNAQIGLFAAALLLIGCLGVLFVSDRANAGNNNPNQQQASERTQEVSARQ
jgi:hypothetical protein